MSPYPNEHSARLLDPDLFETCRRTSRESEGKIYHILTCKYKPGKTPKGKSDWAEQSYRYPIEGWTEAEARAHCEKAGGTFEAAEPEIKATEARKYFFASPVSLKEDEHIVDIEILRSGEWKHPKAPGGILSLPKAKLEEFKQNFDNQVVGDSLPLDIDHKPAKTGAVGWLKKMWINTKDNVAHLFARLDITDPDTQEAVKNGSLKYFSPQIIINYEDPETGKFYDLIRSGALTAWPFIKGMQPAVCNFSELEAAERIVEKKTQSRKSAELLLARENEIVKLKKAGKVVVEGLLKANKQIKLRDKVILKLEAKARIDRLADTGTLSPYEAQKCRELALSEPKSVDLAIELLGDRGKAWEPGQLSILTPRRGSSVMGLTELQQAVDKEKDPARHDRLIELLDNRIEELKREKGIK